MKKGPNRVRKHMWTKEELRKVIKMWESKDTEDLAADLDVTIPQLKGVVVALRKKGFALSRKRRIGYIQPLIDELRIEFKVK